MSSAGTVRTPDNPGVIAIYIKRKMNATNKKGPFLGAL
jgi:hypothetical protein